MKALFSLIIIFYCGFSYASLSDRLQIEEGIRNRLQDFLTVYDNQVKVTVKFEYKIYRESLPGTHLDSEDGTMPTKIESADIRKVSIDIFTSQIEELSDDLKTNLLQLIPVRKNTITINLRKVKPASEYNYKNQVNIQNLDKISYQWLNTFSQVIYLTFGILGLLSATLFTILFIRREKTMREQVSTMAKAISETAGLNTASYGYEDKHFNPDPVIKNSTENDGSEVKNLPMNSLNELFSDCYWTEKDGHAHWLWNQISSEIKSELLSISPFMKAYSIYFMTISPLPFDEYKNPFYLQPISCRHLSMQDLLFQIKKDFSRWHQLSPLRKDALALSLNEKIMALSSPVKYSFVWENIAPSQPRTLSKNLTPILLTEEEETSIFKNVNLVPKNLRESIISLCWLSLLDSSELSKILEKFDARTLAEAWIAAPIVLEKLEQHLPEKKLKALKSYKSRMIANKKSPAYLSLVSVGYQLFSEKQIEHTRRNEAA